MEQDQLAFLSEPSEGPESAPAQPEPAPEPQPQAAPEPAPGPDRGPDGKFVAKAPAPPPEPGHVPITALLDEREKRQAMEKRLAEIEAQKAPPPPPPPEEQLRQALYAQNLRVSRKFAERQYGPETIATVHDWAARRCDEDPHFNAQMMSSDDPYEAAYQAYNREQIVQKVSPERLAAFEAWEAAQAQAQAQAAPLHQPAAAAPPRSLANAPGNGAAGAPHIPTGPGEAFRAVIPR